MKEETKSEATQDEQTPSASRCSSALFCTIGSLDYMVSKRDSIYMSRKGKQDVRVFVRGEWGGRYGEGKYRGLYRTVRVIDADSGELVRDYERVPDDLSVDALRRLGYVNTLGVMAV